MAMVLAVPGVSNEAQAAEENDVMNIGVLQKPDSLNVFKMTLSIGYTINFLVYDTLTSIDRELKPGPQLAESWTTSEDKRTWDFKIDERARWHDGEEVTAEDVAFTFNLILENQKPCALWIDYLSGVQHPVEALDKYTVRITTDEPKATMLSILIPILPEHIWNQVDPSKVDKVDPWDKNLFPDGPIGSGPLILDEYAATLGWIRMYKNPDYHIDTVKVDEVLFKIFSTETSMMSSLYAGSIDVAIDVPPKLWDETLAKTGIGGQAGKALSIFELGINCASEELRENFPKASENLETTNLSVRQAIAMATDKQDIVDDVLQGLADVGDSIIPTATVYWHHFVDEDETMERWDYRIEDAKALLDAAGYVDISGNGVRQNGTSGDALDFSFYYRSGKPDDLAAALKISASLNEIGIRAVPQGISEGQMYNYWLACSMDLFIWAWDTDVDPNFMLSTQTTGQIPMDPQDWTKWSDSFWSNAQYDQWYLDQQYAVDLEERREIIFDMQRLLYYESPYVVLYYPFGLYAYTTTKFTNYPDISAQPGATPGTMWFFFDVTPSSQWVDPMPPEDVYAGPDQTCTVGETLSFTGYAVDENDPFESLNWTWAFQEPDETMTTLWGITVDYTFEQVGVVNVTLTVRDPGGLTGLDDLEVTVMDLPEDAGWLQGFVRDQSADPVVGATVTAGSQSRTTSSTGAYSMALLEGTYTVNATKLGYSVASADATVEAGGTTWVNLTLSITSGTVTGTVYDAEAEDPLAGATVRIVFGDTTRSFLTATDGRYTFSSVSEGDVVVEISKVGYTTNNTTVEVAAGETTVHDVWLEPVEDEKTSNTAFIVGAALIVLIVVVVAAMLLMKRKGASPGQEPPPPE